MNKDVSQTNWELHKSDCMILQNAWTGVIQKFAMAIYWILLMLLTSSFGRTWSPKSKSHNMYSRYEIRRPEKLSPKDASPNKQVPRDQVIHRLFALKNSDIRCLRNNTGPTDGRTDGWTERRTRPIIEMRIAISSVRSYLLSWKSKKENCERPTDQHNGL